MKDDEDARGESNTTTSHGSDITRTNTTDGNRNRNDNLITLELTEDLKGQEIVTNFIFDRKSRQLILSLNHLYKMKTIISPVLPNNWPKTTQEFTAQMELSYDEAFNITKDWLNKCDKIIPLDFNVNAKIKETLRGATSVGYLPMGFSNLKEENAELYNRISSRIADAS